MGITVDEEDRFATNGAGIKAAEGISASRTSQIQTAMELSFHYVNRALHTNYLWRDVDISLRMVAIVDEFTESDG